MLIRSLRDQRGIALLTTLLVAFAVSAIAIAAVMMTLNATLIGKNSERVSVVDAVALTGLEEARSRLNTTTSLYPTVGFTTWENNVAVRDASGNLIPKVTRSTYIGPSGITSGQYGVVGSIISVARDSFGNAAVRRLEVNQESFSKFAYFTNFETDTNLNTIVFGGGDQLRGPVHTNDQMRIGGSPTPAATFFDQVTTANASIVNQSNASFGRPPILSAPRIPMPTVTDLAKLDSLAQVGNVRFTGSMAGDAGEARTRIHFLTIDLGVANGGVHGFFMVYQAGTAIANPEDFVSASLPPAGVTYLRGSDNCGDVRKGRFLSAARHNPIPLATDPVDSVHRHHTTNAANNQDSALIRRTSVVTPDLNRDPVYCYLGGDSILTFPDAGAAWPTTGHRDGGAWVAAPAGIQASLASLGSIITDRPDAGYLFPLTRQWNTNFKGVIYVDGKVILDGVIRGRVTVAAAGNIIFGDDITYFQNPATRDCAFGDIAGYFSGQSIMVSNNTLNAPQTLNNNGSLNTSPAGTFRSYAATNDETIHGFFLTLKTFGAEENSLGSNTDQDCLIGGTFNSGRGCLRTYGGIIQERRGAVGLTGGEGYIKRYEYDVCGATNPPPYYPTTGVFVKNRFYELDPTRFSVAGWFAANQN